MRLLCFEDHSPVERNLSQELLEARSELARLEQMPTSAFVEKSMRRMTYRQISGPISCAVYNKDDAIALAKANIAKLEVLEGGLQHGE